MQWNAVPIPILLQDCAVARCGEWKERNECRLLVCLSVELTDIREKMSWARRYSGSSPKCNHLFIGPLQTFHKKFSCNSIQKFFAKLLTDKKNKPTVCISLHPGGGNDTEWKCVGTINKWVPICTLIRCWHERVFFTLKVSTMTKICFHICSHGTRDRRDTHARTQKWYPTTKFFTGRMAFLPPNQQRQSTEGRKRASIIVIIHHHYHRASS